MFKKKNEVEQVSDEWFTIPNVISFVRIALIPVFMYFYLSKQIIPSLVVLIASGLTDAVDGFIARHFHMISRLGQALDPIADKLTQFAVMLCLVIQIPRIVFPLILIVVKEVVTGIFGLITLKKTGIVKGAKWYGKVTTVLLYLMMALHLVWPFFYKMSPEFFVSENMPDVASWISIILCMVMMMLSFVLYVRRYIMLIRAGRPETKEETAEKTPEEGSGQ